ncbi:hypothetical protein [Acinetobacter modestus]|uniref:hypothetical protein n=1 Tax=Acinetobacter modestus TaxID=1776740 RepID=UPI00301764A2
MTAMQSLIDQFANQEEKIVQIGTFQPHTLVRVHHNPTDLILTNEHAHTIANTTVVLLNDGLERSGLKFKPNIRNLSPEHNSLKLILASTVNQSISIEYQDYPAKIINLEANKPVIINIGEVFGIPMLESTANFFDLAVDGGNSSDNGWTLTNATINSGEIAYSGGLIESNQNGQTVPALLALNAIRIGQKATFAFDPRQLKVFSFGIDTGNYPVFGSSFSDEAINFAMWNNNLHLFGARSDVIPAIDISTLTDCVAEVTFVAEDSVNLKFIGNGNIIAEQLVQMSTFNPRNRIWLSVELNDASNSFTAGLSLSLHQDR